MLLLVQKLNSPHPNNMAMNDEFWPTPKDSVETLQKKIKLNAKMALGTSMHEMVTPSGGGFDDMLSGANDYLANAGAAQHFIKQKQKVPKPKPAPKPAPKPPAKYDTPKKPPKQSLSDMMKSIMKPMH